MIEKHLRRNVGHPWHGNPGWDGMDVMADNPTELGNFISNAQKKHWGVWIQGTVGGPLPEGKPAAYLYKPHKAKGPWTDDPNTLGKVFT